jgi:lysophospholipase L1-like esterase
MIKNTILIVVSMVFAVLVAEGLTRLLVPVRDVGAPFTEFDPVMGRHLKRNFRSVRVTPEFKMTFTSNSHGFRGAEPHSSPLVVFIGDSFTMGYGVDDGLEYPAMIREKLNLLPGSRGAEVVNMGMGNSGNGRWIKLLRTEVAQFEPLVVVLQMSGNDFGDNLSEGLVSISSDGQLVELPVKAKVSNKLESLIDAVPGFADSYLLALIRLAKNGIGRNDAPTSVSSTNDYAAFLTYKIIDEALIMCSNKGYDVLVVLVDFEGTERARAEEFFQVRGVKAIVVPTKKEQPALYYEVDGHWNRAGHSYVADAVFKAMDSEGFLAKLQASKH